jgi:hypothetical protein
VLALHHIEVSFGAAAEPPKTRKAGRWTEAERVRLFVDVCLLAIGNTRADSEKVEDPREACAVLALEERPFIRHVRRYSEDAPAVDEAGRKFRVYKRRGARSKDDVWLARRQPSQRFPHHRKEWARLRALIDEGKARSHYLDPDTAPTLTRKYYEHLRDIAASPALFQKTAAALAAAWASRHGLSNESYFDMARERVLARVEARLAYLRKRGQG